MVSCGLSLNGASGTMASKHSQGSTSLLLKLKLNLLGSMSFILAGWLGKVDEQYSETYLRVKGTKRLSELMTEEAEYWKAKYRADK
jgi:hypothetical protein